MMGIRWVKAKLCANGKSMHRHRRGAIAILAAILLIFLMCMLAFSLDIGYVTNTRAELRRAVDASALAGAGALVEGEAQALSAARLLMSHNPVARRALATEEVDVQLGRWDDGTRTFVPSANDPSAVRVVGTRRDTPLFFARVIGFNSLDVTMDAVATYQPRDIMLVLDYSASMNDDSELAAASHLGTNAVRENLYEIYQDLGSPIYGDMVWEPVPINANAYTVKTILGLHDVPYPYPGGSWDQYIQVVSGDREFQQAGYQRKYGYLTLIAYWLKYRPTYDEIPDHWMTRAQPMESLKNAVSSFLTFLREPDLEDRIGLTVYTSRDRTALVEHVLTYDFDAIERIARQRQAGHYHRETNIGDGIRIAREELLRTARPGALKLMVLMTDGEANLPNNNPAADKQYAMQQAQITVAAGIPILTISLGLQADYAMMEQIAAMSSGIHFNIPGGRRLDEVEGDLIRAFEEIARYRPLKLVK